MKNTRTLIALGWMLVAWSSGCGDDGDEEHTGNASAGTSGSHAGTHASGAMSGAGGGGEAGAQHGGGSDSQSDGGEAGTPDDGPPQPPVMESVAEFEGGLHVTWRNVSMDCDSVEVWRKKDNAEYELAYTLTGEAEAQHDADVEPGSTYCYKARCNEGDDTSTYSNEKCGTL